jgi:hypothetical protein
MLLAGVALALTATAANADQFAGMYGNTVHVTHADGSTGTAYVNADNTWEMHQGDQTMRGTYTWKDDTHFCMTVTDPKPGPNDQGPECNAITGDHKVGDTWTDDDGKGHVTSFSITAGR